MCQCGDVVVADGDGDRRRCACVAASACCALHHVLSVLFRSWLVDWLSLPLVTDDEKKNSARKTRGGCIQMRNKLKSTGFKNATSTLQPENRVLGFSLGLLYGAVGDLFFVGSF